MDMPLIYLQNILANNKMKIKKQKQKENIFNKIFNSKSHLL